MIYYIYKLYCKDTNISDFYIGSTNNVKKRIREHKNCCNNKNDKRYNQYKYQFIRDNGDWNNWTYEILEEFECNFKKDATTKEQQYISNIKPLLNNRNANGRNEERSIESKKEYNKEYYEQNKKRIKEKQKQYRLRKKQLKESISI